jgi:hypothetical protein
MDGNSPQPQGLGQGEATNQKSANETSTNGMHPSEALANVQKSAETTKSDGLSGWTILLSMSVGAGVGGVILAILLFAGVTIATNIIALILIGGALAGFAVGMVIAWWLSDNKVSTDSKSAPSTIAEDRNQRKNKAEALTKRQQKVFVTDGKAALNAVINSLPALENESTIDDLQAADIAAKLKSFQTKLEGLSDASTLFIGLPKIVTTVSRGGTNADVDEFKTKLNGINAKFEALEVALGKSEEDINKAKIDQAYVDLHSEITKLEFESVKGVSNKNELPGKLLKCVTSDSKDSKEPVDFSALIGILNGALEFDTARAAYALIGDTMGQFVLSIAMKKNAAGADGAFAGQFAEQIRRLIAFREECSTKSKTQGFNLLELHRDTISDSGNQNIRMEFDFIFSCVFLDAKASAANNAQGAVLKAKLKEVVDLADQRIYVEIKTENGRKQDVVTKQKAYDAAKRKHSELEAKEKASKNVKPEKNNDEKVKVLDKELDDAGEAEEIARLELEKAKRPQSTVQEGIKNHLDDMFKEVYNLMGKAIA